MGDDAYLRKRIREQAGDAPLLGVQSIRAVLRAIGIGERSDATVRGWFREEKLPGRRFMGCWYATVDDLADFVCRGSA